MEINGTIYRILPQQDVVFGDGTRKVKGGFVIMREGEYAKPVAFELFGDDRLAMLTGLADGMPVKVNFIAVSFEGKNGGYYTTLRCSNVVPLVAANGMTLPQNQMPTAEPEANRLPVEDGLPFDGLPF